MYNLREAMVRIRRSASELCKEERVDGRRTAPPIAFYHDEDLKKDAVKGPPEDSEE